MFIKIVQLFLMCLISNSISGMEAPEGPQKKAKIVDLREQSEPCSLFATPNDNIIGRIALDIKEVGKNGYIGIESPHLSNDVIKKDLINAAQRGAQIRVFTDQDSSDELNKAFTNTLIQITPMDNLHAKRIVIDRGNQKIVWVGSMNMSKNAQSNHEMMMRCTDPAIFEESKTQQLSGLKQYSPVQAINFNSRNIISSGLEEAYNAKKRVIDQFPLCKHPHDYLYFVAYTLDDKGIKDALIAAKRKTNNPITVILDAQNWKKHSTRFEILRPLVEAGIQVYIFNKDEGEKTSFEYNKLMHIKAILRKCDQTCLSLISTANFTQSGRQEINYDLWEPCSLIFSEQLKTIIDAIIKDSEKLSIESFPSEQDLRNKVAQLWELMKYPSIIYQNREPIIRLINERADVNSPNQDGVTFLIRAVETEQEDIVKELIDAGAHVNKFTPEHKHTALQLAAQHGNTEIMQLLLAVPGIELNYADTNGNTPLFKAINTGHDDNAKLLITAGADVNLGGDYRTYGGRNEFKGSRPPLVEAVRQRNPELAEVLLNAGAQVDATDAEGRTALIYACDQSNIDLIKILARGGANLNIVDPKTGKTPLIDAITRRDNNTLKVVQALLDAGADINAKDNQGKTTLYHINELIRANTNNTETAAQLKKIRELLEWHKHLRENPEQIE